MLKEYISKEFSILETDEFHYLPPLCDKEWKKLIKDEDFDERINAILTKDLDYLPASLYHVYFETGSRMEFESRFVENQKCLFMLIVSKLISPEIDNVSKLIDYVWMFCETTTWVLPAHNNHYYTRYPEMSDLPNVSLERTYVDLYSSITGALLSMAYLLYKDEFDRISPLINKRIIKEVYERNVYPILNYDDFGWMGLSAEGRINNWNPWITANGIFCAMCLPLSNHEKRMMLNKSFLLLDNFINYYMPDGGCDEGPCYFYRAGGALFCAVDLIKYVTKGFVDITKEPLIQNMGKYIKHAFLFDDVAANYGDNGYKSTICGANDDYFIGNQIGDETVMNIGILKIHLVDSKITEYSPRIPWSELKGYLNVRQMLEKNDYKIKIESSSLLPDTMLFTAHENADTKGFSVACKGGHNDESHNHNDVGQAMVFLDKKPVIIDPGNCEYTAKTFSSLRYEIPLMNSGYHNLPTINGFMQKDGISYKGRINNYECDGIVTKFSVEIAEAYEKEAKVKTYVRNIVLDRKSQILEISDNYSIEHGDIVLNLMTIGKPIIENNLISTYFGCKIEVLGSFEKIDTYMETEFDKRTLAPWEAPIWHIKIYQNNVDNGELKLLFRK